MHHWCTCQITRKHIEPHCSFTLLTIKTSRNDLKLVNINDVGPRNFVTEFNPNAGTHYYPLLR